MIQSRFQQTLSRTLALGAAGVTVFLMVGNVTDPVNAPKLFILGGVAGAAFALLGYQVVQKTYRFTRLEVFVLLFLFWSLLSLSASDSPLTQGIYGVYGRNTGVLTYAFLGIISIAASQITSNDDTKRILWGFLIALGINLTYGLWVLLFGDFLGWQNIYGALLGTFGNPNFISSYLGMGFSLVLALSIHGSRKFRLIYVLVLILITWQLIEADSLQGIIVALIGLGLVGFFWLRDKSNSAIFPNLYLFSGIFTAVVAVFGVLGFGPLKQILSQPTVALREQYWLAALNISKSHPFFGVGPDSYGDWYRRARSPQALITPGPDTVTNTAHNVFLDLLAGGGYPILALYILISGLGAYSIIWTTLKVKKYDPVFVGIVVLWVGYQAQSIISINQIGLAIWGWLINGVAISYRLNHKNALLFSSVSRNAIKLEKRAKKDIFSPQLILSLGAIMGLLVAVPPLSADAKWRKVQISRQVENVEPALRGEYLSPLSSYRLAEAVQLLENSKLPDLAIKYARLGVKFNPDYFEAWRFLYYATNSTADEKMEAKNQLMRLDPLNPAWKELN